GAKQSGGSHVSQVKGWQGWPRLAEPIPDCAPFDPRSRFMKLWTKLMTLLVVFGLAGVAQAKEKKGEKGGVRGKITAVSADSITIDSGTKKQPGEKHTYKIAGTTVSINGELKTVAGLQG